MIQLARIETQRGDEVTMDKSSTRTSDEGKVIYYIAPFDSQTEAESLVAKLRAAGAKGLSTDTIK